MTFIGGFFELELSDGKRNYHPEALNLSTGRACLNLIFQLEKPSKIYLPYYVCDAVLEPILLNSIKFEHYALNEHLDPVRTIELNDYEYYIYVNYFGLKNRTIHTLVEKYGNKLIVDNSQAFFEKKYSGVFSFNSARKFFGVPDGAYLYSTFPITLDFARNTSIKIEHLVNRMLGNQKLAYKQFIENESHMDSEIKLMSKFSERVLGNVDYLKIMEQRRANFNYFHNNLAEINRFKIPQDNNGVPFCYPFLPKNKIDRKSFHQRNIFIPKLWQRSISLKNEGFDIEKDYAERLLPLPVDQRVTKKDCDKVIELILRS